MKRAGCGGKLAVIRHRMGEAGVRRTSQGRVWTQGLREGQERGCEAPRVAVASGRGSACRSPLPPPT